MDRKFSSNKIVLIILLLLTPIGQISIDIYTISLPAIAKSLSTSNELVRATITAFLFSYGIGQLIYGVLSDAYGRKKILAYALPVYIISTLFIPLMPSIYCIILLRFVQGLSISAVSVITKSIAVDVYKGGAQLTKVVSYMTMVWGASPILAPLIGGYIHSYLGWKFNFYILGVTTFFIYLCMMFLLKETFARSPPFLWKQTFQRYYDVLKNPLFWECILIIALSCINLIGFTVLSPYVLQNYYYLTPLQNSYVSFLVVVFFIVGNKLCYLGKHVWSIMSCIALVSLTIYLKLYLNQLNLSEFLTFSIIIMFFVGILFPFSMAKCLQLFPNNSGVVSALIGFISLFFCASVMSLINFVCKKSEFLLPIALSYSSVGIIFISLLLMKKNAMLSLGGYNK